jgi:hypothetical protein
VNQPLGGAKSAANRIPQGLLLGTTCSSLREKGQEAVDKLLPQPITNRYDGAPIAKWVFILLTVVTVGRSLAHIFLPDGGAQSIATIPLDSFTSNGGATVIQIFALWGLSQLLFGLLSIVVLWHYQSLIPLMYLFILFEYVGRLLLAFAKPIVTDGTAPGAIGNFVLIPLALLMLVLSLREKKHG